MRRPAAELAVVRRGGFDESRHLGDVVVLGADGETRLSRGDPDAVMLPRSTLKIVQAEVCLEAGAPLEGRTLALAAASHLGQDAHAEAVAGMLDRAGLTAEALGCPPDWPIDEETHSRLQAAGEGQQPIRMNCSGKHAAMLLACVQEGWPTTSYLDVEHPLQQRIRSAVERATGDTVEFATVDGCGAPLLAVTLTGLARAYRRLALADDTAAAGKVAAAMRAHPEYVAGEGHPNTEAMQLLPGFVAKGGAEGVLAMVAPGGEAVAVKVADGSARAATMIALTALAATGVDVSGAAKLMDVAVRGGGRRVGSIVPGAAFA